MLNDIKTCNIIYGYTDNCILDYNNSPIILIEPRKRILDKINKSIADYKNVILIKKLLVVKKNVLEIILYNDKKNDVYWSQDINQDSLFITGTNCLNIGKETVYTTSLLDIIKQYKIQNIKNLVININVKNNNDILESLEPFNHIISYIKIKMDDFECKLFNNFYKELETQIYTHKNLKIDLPNIGVYFNEFDQNMNFDKLSLLLNQYQMSLIIPKKQIICYPESIKMLNTIYNEVFKKNTTKSCVFHERIINNLDIVFNKHEKQNENDTCNLDIIIQFNTKYLNSNNTLQIMYPLKNDVIYINKTYDIIYATRDCMYMLYQIIKSKYFSDYLEEKRQERPTLFKLMSKRYFYDYISKIFIIKIF